MNRRILLMLIGVSLATTGITGCGQKEEQNVTPAKGESEVQEDQLLIDTASADHELLYADYDADGVTIQVMLYKDDDNVIHGAFNTCQVCNGSPYAYFEQEGEEIVCQNCGNHFSIEDIGDVHGGCNPIPLEFTQEGDSVRIDVNYLLDNVDIFENWKQGI